MRSFSSFSSEAAHLALRVPLNETLMTIMALSDQPIYAFASDGRDKRDPAKNATFCHIVRVDDRWPLA